MKIKKDEAWQKQVGQRLAAVARVLGKKHVEIATVAGVSPQAWANYVAGSRPLDLDAAMSLCVRYGLSLDWIYRGVPTGLQHAIADRLVEETGSVVVSIKRR